MLGLGVDLAALGTPHLSWRRLRNLIDRLPRHSHFRQELDGPAWSVTDSLLDLLLYVQQMAASGGDAKAELLAPQYRTKKPTRPIVPADRMRAELAKWRNGETPDFT